MSFSVGLFLVVDSSPWKRAGFGRVDWMFIDSSLGRYDGFFMMCASATVSVDRGRAVGHGIDVIDSNTDPLIHQNTDSDDDDQSVSLHTNRIVAGPHTRPLVG